MIITVRPTIETKTRRVGLEFSNDKRVLWSEYLGYEIAVSHEEHLEVLRRVVTEGIELQIEQETAAEIMIEELE